MPTVSFKSIKGSAKTAHQQVLHDDTPFGEVWREQVSVVVSKLTEPQRRATKWRWFAKKDGASTVFGRGTRAALLLGPGFSNKDKALEAMAAHSEGAKP